MPRLPPRLGRVRLMLDTALALNRLGSFGRDEAAGAPALIQQIRDSVRGTELDGAALELRLCL